MKIAITGAAGVGKTTIAKAISESFPEINLLPEAARLALDLGFKLDHDADLEAEVWITAKQIELERQTGSWVADRCFIDLAIYLQELFGNKPEFDFLIKLVEKIATRQMMKYDLVLYLPSGEFPLEADGVRNIDPRFQTSIDQSIRNWLVLNGSPYLTIRGNPEARLKQVKDLIEKSK